uniref:Pectinesterase inhibitor domain-containing protein n=1 Tax=Oryza meridionalis TaxID=40149 RepID=A0A0E0C030_9ORYZ
MARSPAHATLLLVVAVVAAAACWTTAAGENEEVAEICKKTSYPEVCIATAGKQASKYGATVDPLAVLNMQVDAFAMRTEAARKHLTEAVKTATPKGAKALDLCDSLYLDVEDNLGAARRAIGFKDAVTIRAMMGMAAQDMQGCDEQFRKVGEKNPMDHFNRSLLEMSEICRSLSNMI